jgi:hypothetical protein
MNLRVRAVTGAGMALLLAAGCARAPLRIPKAEIARLRAEPEIRVVRYAPATITVQTRGGDAARQFGLLGLGVGQSVDQGIRSKLMNELGLQDPAPAVGDRLAAAFTADLGLTNLRPIEQPAPSDDLDELRRRFGGGGALDVKTLVWWLAYDASATDAYRLLYAARARLVRLEGAAVIWEATCDRPVGDSPTAKPDELTANGGALLKQRAAESVDWCARRLLRELRGR